MLCAKISDNLETLASILYTGSVVGGGWVKAIYFKCTLTVEWFDCFQVCRCYS